MRENVSKLLSLITDITFYEGYIERRPILQILFFY